MPIQVTNKVSSVSWTIFALRKLREEAEVESRAPIIITALKAVVVVVVMAGGESESCFLHLFASDCLFV